LRLENSALGTPRGGRRTVPILKPSSASRGVPSCTTLIDIVTSLLVRLYRRDMTDARVLPTFVQNSRAETSITKPSRRNHVLPCKAAGAPLDTIHLLRPRRCT
jgi:hypothetical protein